MPVIFLVKSFDLIAAVFEDDADHALLIGSVKVCANGFEVFKGLFMRMTIGVVQSLRADCVFGLVFSRKFIDELVFEP